MTYFGIRKAVALLTLISCLLPGVCDASSIEVTGPTASLKAGQLCKITWDYPGATYILVRIQLCTDEGCLRDPYVIAETINNGEYEWQVPDDIDFVRNFVLTRAVLRVEDVDFPSQRFGTRKISIAEKTSGSARIAYVEPHTVPMQGGYPITIWADHHSGDYLGSGDDVYSVKIAGLDARILSQSKHQVVVESPDGQQSESFMGDVVVKSSIAGTIEYTAITLLAAGTITSITPSVVNCDSFEQITIFGSNLGAADVINVTFGNYSMRIVNDSSPDLIVVEASTNVTRRQRVTVNVTSASRGVSTFALAFAWNGSNCEQVSISVNGSSTRCSSSAAAEAIEIRGIGLSSGDIESVILASIQATITSQGVDPDGTAWVVVAPGVAPGSILGSVEFTSTFFGYTAVPDAFQYLCCVNDTCGVCGGDNSTCTDPGCNPGQRKDACFVCGGNNATCTGCDGVVNSGATYDACDVCGGNNTACRPTVTGLTPSYGPVNAIGTVVTVNGTNFVGSSNLACVFGGYRVILATFLSTNQVACTLPRDFTQIESIVVEVSFRRQSTLSNAFTQFVTTSGITYTLFATPKLRDVSPTFAPISGGSTITLTGFNFFTGGLVSDVKIGIPFGIYPDGSAVTDPQFVTAATRTANNVTFVLPPKRASESGNALPIEISFNSFDFTKSSPKVVLTYYADYNVSSISPSSGPLGGGTPVTIAINTSFAPGSAFCRFNGTRTVSATAVSSGLFVCRPPAVDSPGTVTIEFTFDQFLYRASPVNFAYYVQPYLFNLNPQSAPTDGGTNVSFSLLFTGGFSGLGIPPSLVASSLVLLLNSTSVASFGVDFDRGVGYFIAPRSSSSGASYLQLAANGINFTLGSDQSTFTYYHFPTFLVSSLSVSSVGLSGGATICIRASSSIRLTSITVDSTAARCAFLVGSVVIPFNASSITNSEVCCSSSPNVSLLVTIPSNRVFINSRFAFLPNGVDFPRTTVGLTDMPSAPFVIYNDPAVTSVSPPSLLLTSSDGSFTISGSNFYINTRLNVLLGSFGNLSVASGSTTTSLVFKVTPPEGVSEPITLPLNLTVNGQQIVYSTTFSFFTPYNVTGVASAVASLASLATSNLTVTGEGFYKTEAVVCRYRCGFTNGSTAPSIQRVQAATVSQTEVSCPFPSTLGSGDCYVDISLDGVSFVGVTDPALFVNVYDATAPPQVSSITPQTVSVSSDSLFTMTGTNFANLSSLQCLFTYEGSVTQVSATFGTSCLIACPFSVTSGVAGTSVAVNVTNDNVLVASAVSFKLSSTVASSSVASFESLLVIAGVNLTATVQSGLESTAVNTAGGDTFDFVFVLTDTAEPNVVPVPAFSSDSGLISYWEKTRANRTSVVWFNASSAGNGQTTQSYSITKAGNYSVGVYFGGVQVQGSPFELTVDHADMDPASCTYTGLSGTSVQVSTGTAVTYILYLRDKYSNFIDQAGDFFVLLSNPQGQNATIPVVAAGSYSTFSQTFVDVGQNVLYIFLQNISISDIPQQISVVPGDASATQSTLVAVASEFTAGTDSAVNATLYDAFRGLRSSAQFANIDLGLLQVYFYVGDNGTSISSVDQSHVFGANLDEDAGGIMYDATYVLTGAGRYQALGTLSDGDFGQNVTFAVLPSSLDKSVTANVLDTVIMVAGTTVAINVTARDAYNNMRAGDPSDGVSFLVLNATSSSTISFAYTATGYLVSFSANISGAYVITTTEYATYPNFLQVTVNVTAASLNIARSELYLSANVSAGSTSTLVFVPRDVYGNIIPYFSSASYALEALVVSDMYGVPSGTVLKPNIPFEGNVLLSSVSNTSQAASVLIMYRLVRAGYATVNLYLTQGNSAPVALPGVPVYQSPLDPPQISSISFDNSGARIFIDFNVATNRARLYSGAFTGSVGTSAYCAFLLTSSSLAPLADATCSWPTRQRLQVLLTSSSTVIPGNTLTVKANLILTRENNSNFMAESGSAVVAPVDIPTARAAITGKNLVGRCIDVTVLGVQSAGSAGRTLNFTWSVNSTALEAYIVNGAGQDRINFGQDLPAGFYSVQLVVTNFLGSVSQPAVFVFEARDTVLPVADVFGAPTSAVDRSVDVVLIGRADLPVCAEQVKLGLRWEVLGDAGWTLPATIDASSFELRIPAYTLPPPSSSSSVATFVARFYLTLTTSGGSETGLSFTQFNVTAAPLRAIIAGGGSLYRSMQSSITLDGSPSFDPDLVNINADVSEGLKYTWLCFNYTFAAYSDTGEYGISCTDPSTGQLLADLLPNDVVIVLSSGVLAYDNSEQDPQNPDYIFSLVVSKNGKDSVTADIRVFVTKSSPAIVNIQTTATRVNRADTFVLTASATDPERPDALIAYEWTVYDDDLVEVDVASISGSRSPYQPTFTVAANTLTDGASYLFQVSAYGYILDVNNTDDNVNTTVAYTGATGYAQLNVTVNNPPVAGTFTITPASSAAGNFFTLIAQSWTDDLPGLLSYSFGFVDPVQNIDQVLTPTAPATFVNVTLPAGNANESYGLVVFVRVYDVEGAVTRLTQNVTVTIPDDPASVADSVFDSQVAYNNLTGYYDSSTAGLLIASTLSAGGLGALEDKRSQDWFSDSSNSGRCVDDCNSHGTCGSDLVCQCSSGFKGRFCQLTSTQYQSVIDARNERCRRYCNTGFSLSGQVTLRPDRSDTYIGVYATCLSNDPSDLSSGLTSSCIDAMQSVASGSKGLTGTGSGLILYGGSQGLQFTLANTSTVVSRRRLLAASAQEQQIFTMLYNNAIQQGSSMACSASPFVGTGGVISQAVLKGCGESFVGQAGTVVNVSVQTEGSRPVQLIVGQDSFNYFSGGQTFLAELDAIDVDLHPTTSGLASAIALLRIYVETSSSGSTTYTEVTELSAASNASTAPRLFLTSSKALVDGNPSVVECIVWDDNAGQWTKDNVTTVFTSVTTAPATEAVECIVFSASRQYAVRNVPVNVTVTQVTPNIGLLTIDSVLTITGTDFYDPGPGLVQVRFTSSSSAFTFNATVANVTTMTLTVPAGTLSVDAWNVSVSINSSPFENSVLVGQEVVFNVIAAPVITAMVPRSGPSTGTITFLLSGTNFGVFQSIVTAPLVYFNVTENKAASTSYNDSGLAVTMPENFGVTGVFEVFINLEDVITVGPFSTLFIVYDNPVVVSSSPLSGPSSGGTNITLLGSGFLDTGESAAKVGSSDAAAATFVSATEMTFTTVGGLTGNTTASIALALNGQNFITWSNATLFVYDTPVISRVAPPNIRQNATLTMSVYGNFVRTPELDAGTAFCQFYDPSLQPLQTSIAVWNATLSTVDCQFNASELAQGAYSVDVALNAQQTTGTRFYFNVYVNGLLTGVTLTSISPLGGPVSGSTSVTIQGNITTSLNATCKFGDYRSASPALVVANASVSCLTPSVASASSRRVTLIIEDLEYPFSDEASVSFVYYADPVVSLVKPTTLLFASDATPYSVLFNVSSTVNVTANPAFVQTGDTVLVRFNNSAETQVNASFGSDATLVVSLPVNSTTATVLGLANRPVIVSLVVAPNAQQFTTANNYSVFTIFVPSYTFDVVLVLSSGTTSLTTTEAEAVQFLTDQGVSFAADQLVVTIFATVPSIRYKAYQSKTATAASPQAVYEAAAQNIVAGEAYSSTATVSAVNLIAINDVPYTTPSPTPTPTATPSATPTPEITPTPTPGPSFVGPAQIYVQLYDPGNWTAAITGAFSFLADFPTDAVASAGFRASLLSLNSDIVLSSARIVNFTWSADTNSSIYLNFTLLEPGTLNENPSSTIITQISNTLTYATTFMTTATLNATNYPYSLPTGTRYVAQFLANSTDFTVRPRVVITMNVSVSENQTAPTVDSITTYVIGKLGSSFASRLTVTVTLDSSGSRRRLLATSSVYTIVMSFLNDFPTAAKSDPTDLASTIVSEIASTGTFASYTVLSYSVTSVGTSTSGEPSYSRWLTFGVAATIQTLGGTNASANIVQALLATLGPDATTAPVTSITLFNLAQNGTSRRRRLLAASTSFDVQVSNTNSSKASSGFSTLVATYSVAGATLLGQRVTSLNGAAVPDAAPPSNEGSSSNYILVAVLVPVLVGGFIIIVGIAIYVQAKKHRAFFNRMGEDREQIFTRGDTPERLVTDNVVVV